MPFILLVAFSALFVAGCAAFFSIKGLIILFSGSALAIGIMASSLELGKLVAASFLHNYWKSISFLLKTYLCIAVITLMGITSLGIFGFLTGAHQVHSTAVKTFETKIESLENEKKALDETAQVYQERIKTLTEMRAGQEKRVIEAGNYKTPRDQAYKAITEANNEIAEKEKSVAKNKERNIEIDKEVAELKIQMNTTTDVGSFKFIAGALNTDVDTSIRYFILALIFVFDPLAVTLVLALNKMLEIRKASRKQEDDEYLEKILNRPVETIEASVEKTEEAPVSSKKKT